MKTEILIVGAGPTGLGAAWELTDTHRYNWLLCELSGEAGGLAGSVIDDYGFTWDFGGHVQFSHYGYFDKVMDGLLQPHEWVYHQRESWVWICGCFVPYPFQLNIHRLPEPEQVQCLRGLISAARRARPVAPTDTFATWVEATNGDGIGRLFLKPYNEKVWAYPLTELSWNWIGERVAHVDLARLVENMRAGRDHVSWGPNREFRFPRRGGTGEVWRRLAIDLSRRQPSHLRFKQRLVRVDTCRREAVFAGGLTVRYRVLISTMPIDRLVALSDRHRELVDAVSLLKHSSTHVVGIALIGAPGAHLAGKCWVYYPEDNCPFYRVTVFSHYSPLNVPDSSQYWSLMAEVSESPSKQVDATTIIDAVLEGLVAAALIPDRSVVHHVWHRRLEYGYPTPTLERDQALCHLLPVLERVGVFSRGRFGAWKYEVSNQDHSFAQGVECVRHLMTGSPEQTLSACGA
jgi:protoporphyrinogen oxidase